MTSNKFRQTLTISRVGKVSASLLFLLLLLFLSPSCNQHWLGDVATYAMEDSSTASTNLNVNIQTAISVGLQQAVEMDITPKLDGTFAKNAAKMQWVKIHTIGLMHFTKTTELVIISPWVLTLLCLLLEILEYMVLQYAVLQNSFILKLTNSDVLII